jgi:tetrahydromethanopterin S-methyltransferase subunit A
VERFRKQITAIDLINEGSPEVVRQAVCACYQELPTPFRGYTLRDPGAWPEPPISGKITWLVANPEREPKNEAERAAGDRLRDLMARVKRAVEGMKAPE